VIFSINIKSEHHDSIAIMTSNRLITVSNKEPTGCVAQLVRTQTARGKVPGVTSLM